MKHCTQTILFVRERYRKTSNKKNCQVNFLITPPAFTIWSYNSFFSKFDSVAFLGFVRIFTEISFSWLFHVESLPGGELRRYEMLDISQYIYLTLLPRPLGPFFQIFTRPRGLNHPFFLK